MSRILRDTKELYYDYMIHDEKDGDCFMSNPKAAKRDNIGVRELRFIKRYLSLILNTNIISDNTKTYLRWCTINSNNRIVEEIVADSKKRNSGKIQNKHTMLAMLNYDQKKLQKYFDDDMLLKIKTKTYKDLSVYEQQLNVAIAKYSNSSELKKGLALEVPVTEICGQLSDSDFKKLVEIIKPYSKAVMEQLVDSIPNEMKAYLNFLLYAGDKSGKDLERYEVLKKLFTIGLEGKELKELQDKFAVHHEAIDVEKEKLEKPTVEIISDNEEQKVTEEVAEKSELSAETSVDEPTDLYPNRNRIQWSF